MRLPPRTKAWAEHYFEIIALVADWYGLLLPARRVNKEFRDSHLYTGSTIVIRIGSAVVPSHCELVVCTLCYTGAFSAQLQVLLCVEKLRSLVGATVCLTPAHFGCNCVCISRAFRVLLCIRTRAL